MPNKLNLNTAEDIRRQITDQQQKEIEGMYRKVARNIDHEAKNLPNTTSGTLRKMYLNELQKQINKELTTLGKTMEQMITDNMANAAGAMVDANLDFLKQVHMPIQGAFSHVPTDIVQTVASGQLYAGDWSLSRAIWKNTQKSQGDINTIIAEGITQNKSVYDIAKDLEKYVNPSAKKEWDWSKVYPGTAKKVDYNAQRLARTMVSHAYQQSFVRTTQKNPFVTKYQWDSSNSSRTCELCTSRDGQLYDKDDLPMDHPNGMCTYIAVMSDSMVDIADRIADWASGKPDPDLDAYVKDLFPPKESSPKKLVEAKIDSLPQFQNSKYKQNVIPLASGDIRMRVAGDLRYTREENDLGIQHIPISKLESLQKRISADNLKSMLGSGINIDNIGDDPVQVVLCEGHYVLLDGNHRSSLAKIMGLDEIKAQVFRLPP